MFFDDFGSTLSENLGFLRGFAPNEHLADVGSGLVLDWSGEGLRHGRLQGKLSRPRYLELFK